MHSKDEPADTMAVSMYGRSFAEQLDSDRRVEEKRAHIEKALDAMEYSWSKGQSWPAEEFLNRRREEVSAVESRDSIERRLRREAKDRRYLRMCARVQTEETYYQIEKDYHDELLNVEEKAKDELARQVLNAL